MLYLVCPTCKKLLGDKELYFENQVNKINNDIDEGILKTQDEIEQAKKKLIDTMGFDRYCCKMRILTYVELVKIIK